MDDHHQHPHGDEDYAPHSHSSAAMMTMVGGSGSVTDAAAAAAAAADGDGDAAFCHGSGVIMYMDGAWRGVACALLRPLGCVCLAANTRNGFFFY